MELRINRVRINRARPVNAKFIDFSAKIVPLGRYSFHISQDQQRVHAGRSCIKNDIFRRPPAMPFLMIGVSEILYCPCFFQKRDLWIIFFEMI